MTKSEFVSAITQKLSGLPSNEVEERIAFYSEIIDDAVEEGKTEAEAVASLGEVNDVVEQIIASMPIGKIASERLKNSRRLKAWEIILIALGSPIWLSLVISLISVVFSLFATFWSIIIAFWSIFVSVSVSGASLVLAGIIISISENAQVGFALIGIGLICLGISVLLFFACKIATKGAIYVTKKIPLWIKRLFVKEN